MPATPRTHSQRVVGPGSRPIGRAVGGGRAPEPERPTPRQEAPPPGALPPPRQRAKPARKSARSWVGEGSPAPHPPAPAASWYPAPAARPEGGQPGEGERLTQDAPHNGGRHPPPGTPFRQPYGAQRQPVRARAAGPLLGPHTRTDRTRDTRVAEPRLPAPEDGQPGEGQRLTSDAPHNGGRPPPLGTAPHHPHGTHPPQGMQARGTVLRPHTHTPAPTARAWQTPTARPLGGQSGEGGRLTSDAPHNDGRHPTRGRPSATPTASNAGPQGRTLWGRCWVPTPAPTAPGTHRSRYPGRPPQRTGGRGRDGA